MGNVILKLRDIDVVFTKANRKIGKKHHFHVLKHLSLDIEEGQILAVVGESGCGKTTLGRVITGLLKPTKGKITYKGNNIYGFIKKDFDVFRNEVQFVQQDSYAALNPVRTIYQSLSAPIKNRNKKITKEELNKKIEDLLALVGLTPAEQFLSKYPHQLSGGQRQRILLARALSLDPKVIVADEPVSMIDVSLRLSILKLMSQLNKDFNITFVYITHDLGTAKYIADGGKIAVMYLGQIVEYGEINKLLANPRHPYSQALISAVPVPDPRISKNMPSVKIKGMEMSSLEYRNNGCPFYARCLYCREGCETNDIKYEEEDGVKIMCPHYKNLEK